MAHVIRNWSLHVKPESWVQNFLKIPNFYFIQFPDGECSQFWSLFLAEEPLVSKMHLGWWHIRLGIEFCFFKEKSWVQNFLKLQNIILLNFRTVKVLNFCLFPRRGTSSF